jgi:hypothetical protein
MPPKSPQTNNFILFFTYFNVDIHFLETGHFNDPVSLVFFQRALEYYMYYIYAFVVASSGDNIKIACLGNLRCLCIGFYYWR